MAPESLIAPKLGHYLCVRTRIERARASDDEHDPLVQVRHALRASWVIVSREFDFDTRDVVARQLKGIMLLRYRFLLWNSAFNIGSGFAVGRSATRQRGRRRGIRHG